MEKYLVYTGQGQIIGGRWANEHKQLEGVWAKPHHNEFLSAVHKLFKKNHMVYIEVSGTQFRGEKGSVCKHLLNNMERWAIQNTKTCRLLRSVPEKNIYILNRNFNLNPPSGASLLFWTISTHI